MFTTSSVSTGLILNILGVLADELFIIGAFAEL